MYDHDDEHDCRERRGVYEGYDVSYTISAVGGACECNKEICFRDDLHFEDKEISSATSAIMDPVWFVTLFPSAR